ncbi:unnamed protein product [Lactuca virosa]|uniref:Uncharacterized protein n=1 Tax=Lactuca virosa TaxID=75947 RepID=A0AAU9P5Z0_9ASTR|nr:unnamed protein product [Lactuca virosa]
MGTPAIPNLGEQCSVNDCKLIDFLPFTCDCCNKVFCLEHRSYSTHECPNANKNDITVVICPLCAKGVHLVPNQDPNITWESHVNTDCDPSNYEKATKKKKCPVRGCKETLTFSNTIKCRDCTIDHCLKHRFGPDHTCPGPKKPEPTFPILGAASSVKASAGAGIVKWSNDIGQVFQGGKDGEGGSSGGERVGQMEVCPVCSMKFSRVGDLIDHVQKVHEKKEVMKVTLDVCPKCSKGFRDPVALVEHVEREHRGTSKA